MSINDTILSTSIAHNIAIIRMKIGDFEEAEKVLKKIHFINAKKEKSATKQFSLISYLNIVTALNSIYISLYQKERDSIIKRKLLDSTTYYNKLGFEKSKFYKKENYYNYFVIHRAIMAYELKAYEAAIYDLNNALEKAVKIPQKENIPSIYFYLGKSHQKLNNFNKAITYYKKVDSLTTLHEEESIYLSETYASLADIYKQKNEPQTALKYYNLFTENNNKTQSITTKIWQKINSEYKTVILEHQIQELIHETESKKRKLYLSFIIIGFLILSFLGTLFYIRKKKKQNRLAFDKLIQELETTKKEVRLSEHKSKSGITIDEKKVVKILNALEAFEEKKHFLNINCDLAFVAKKVKTNKAYLSKIIHSKKQQKFIQYITNLRINYALEKLKEDKVFRSYDIKSIATELGFKSPDSFSRAFKSKTGIYPSYYIKSINKINSLKNIQ